MAFAVLLIAGALILVRAWHQQRLVAEVDRRRSLAADGIVVGGEGFVFSRPGRPAVLLLHGAGDTPQTLRYLGAALAENGFHVEAPLLPGHGRSVADFRHVRADQLLATSRDAYSRLHGAHPAVGIAGLSMGGALAARLASESSDLRALVLLAPYLSMPAGIQRAARWSAWWGPLMPVFRSAEGLSILDPSERAANLAYGVFTASALRALYEIMRRGVEALPRVSAPTLMIQSREDNRISVSDGERAFAAVGSAEKRLEWVTGAAHVITVDHGHDRVIASVVGWMTAHLSQ